MKRRIPPLRALQAFEAAARTSNFSQAARELNVTSPAISSQVKALESFLQVELFARKPQGLLLTRAGTLYFEVLTDAFAMIEAATQRVAPLTKRATLSIAAPPSFASGWLIPRLASFRSAHNFDLQITSTSRLTDPTSDGFEAVIRLGRGGWNEVTGDHLFTERLVPVCAPLPVAAPRGSGGDTRMDASLLVSMDDAEAWDDWFAARSEIVSRTDRVHFGDVWMTVQAALSGAGIALCDRAIVDNELASGRLVVASSEEPLVRGIGYFLVYQEPLTDRMNALREWLFQQTGSRSAVAGSSL